MKKHRTQTWIILGLMAASILIFVIWKSCNPSDRQIHTLDAVLVYAEQKGPDYAADRLDYLIVNSYRKDELHKSWGAPTEKILNADADLWILSADRQLAVYYDNNGEVTKIDILTGTAFD